MDGMRYNCVSNNFT